MSLDARGAEATLKEHAAGFYNSLVEEYPEGFPVTAPLQKDKQLYWEEQLRSKHPTAYPIYYLSKLDAFTFFVGLEAKEPKVQVRLAKYGALKKLERTVSKEKLEQLGQKIEQYYDLAGAIFLSRLYVERAKESRENAEVAKGYAKKAVQALGRVVAFDYNASKYEAYCKFDPTLKIDKDAMLTELKQAGLIEPKDLKNQECVRNSRYGNSVK